MRQTWRDLLFLHWRFEPEEIQTTLPAGLSVDTFDGSAWVGVVPFRMEGIRLGRLPPLPGTSSFPEMNLRTYVSDASGRPGVWFYSLEAGNRLAVFVARTFFHLNYRFAAMSATEGPNSIHYECRRAGAGRDEPLQVFEWNPPTPAEAREAEPGGLPHFLLERYRLFARHPRSGRLHTGLVSHEPYRFHETTPAVWSTRLFELNGFAPVERPPDSSLACPGFSVRIHPLHAAIR